MPGFEGLRGRTALVTGAGSGIGRAIALRLADEGMRVGILDLDAAGGSATADTIAAASGQAQAWPVDITDFEAVEAAVTEAEAGLGPIHGLVNNAGWDLAASFLETGPQEWRKLIEINLLGPLNVTKVVLTRMSERGAGRIVSIASDAGRVGSSGESVYAACKGGVIALGKSIAREVANQGITVNCVSPGPSDTPLFSNFDPSGKLAKALERAIPMRRLGQPEDYPGIVALLLSDDAAFITGQTISVSGGLTMHG